MLIPHYCFYLQEKQVSSRPFAYTGHSMRNLERIAVCVQQQEPVLLVGETGTGKTTLVQYLAEQVSMPLIVMVSNLILLCWHCHNS